MLKGVMDSRRPRSTLSCACSEGAGQPAAMNFSYGGAIGLPLVPVACQPKAVGSVALFELLNVDEALGTSGRATEIARDGEGSVESTRAWHAGMQKNMDAANRSCRNGKEKETDAVKEDNLVCLITA